MSHIDMQAFYSRTLRYVKLIAGPSCSLESLQSQRNQDKKLVLFHKELAWDIVDEVQKKVIGLLTNYDLEKAAEVTGDGIELPAEKSVGYRELAVA